ncbi:MAG: hypothetical protein HYY06_29665 [Deltaproteobacteria bacterium]|nr:hypothetical protein [Deltaproteobacteria bacterium]
MAASEWLEWLLENRSRYLILLDETGSLAVAAHTLAKARCQVSAISTDVPNAREVHAAASEIAGRTGRTVPLPSPGVLASECRALGLAMI